jgi:hypothetical protein
MIYDKVNRLIQRIDDQIVRDGYSDMRTAFLAFTLDVVSEYSLGQSFGLLEDENLAKGWGESMRALAWAIPWTRQFNWIIPLSQKIPIAFMRTVSPGMARVAGMHHVSLPSRYISPSLSLLHRPTRSLSVYIYICSSILASLMY